MKMLIILVILLSTFQSSVGFDYYVLSEMWPPGYCYKNPSCDFTKKLSKFVIHGLWPQNTPPCQTSVLPKFPAGTLKRLNKNWPSITHRENWDFWQAEWDNHGCCSMLPATDYFKLTLDLYDRADIKEILRKEGIVPQVDDVAKRYTKKEIEDPIKLHIGKIPQLICNQDKLAEVRLCFDKTPDHKYKDCSLSSNCPAVEIKFPYLYTKPPVMDPQEEELLRAIPPPL